MRLAQRGLTSWTPKRTRDGLMAGMVRHPASITLEDERKAVRSIGRMRVEIERLDRAGQNGLLISEENLIGSMRGNVSDTRLYPLLSERLMRFKPAFEGRKLRIGFGIRSYEAYWTSCLSRLVTRGAPTPSVDLLDFLTTQPRRWRHVIRDISLTFPDADLFVWPFERMAGSPARQLGVLWGGDCRGLDGGDAWHSRSCNVWQMNEILALRGEAPIEGGPLETGAHWMPFDDEQTAVLRAEYRRDLAWLASGAQGMAAFVDGRPTPTPSSKAAQVNGQTMPEIRPDRADVTRTSVKYAVPLRGRQNGIEEGLGRTGAS
ncbi:hypothetical protein Q4555_11260 [Octadecabacter sp. 1_MG-2023]|uniref:hypothetical protein n=1 Tax=unclassified Octadecabacter TaxID=196158 RepID=UPI001C090385|nr:MULTISPECIES: hypothetical protein [unclassified Octadecabacter]MBU2993907.1 hypothetical protein [Octadecabacter sp. B2R22]MDO6735247.1 hypothetical protein [Octadecabacter sp. 1_MG-2023]